MVLLQKSYLQEFEERTARSRELFLEAKEIMPGGVTANIKSFEPYPLFMKEGRGARLYDHDGNVYVDYTLSYGALMLGHGHPKIVEAVQHQLLEDGTTLFGTPHELEMEMGKKIKALYPSMEKIRYTNSGTEATLLAIRLAYAYTGKTKIAKFEGHYHGGYDQVLLSINPSLEEAGEEHAPKPVVESKGVDPYHEEHTIVLPFNDLEHTADILKEHQAELAAVIIEPVQGGFIPPEPEFLEGLRTLTDELGILLIFDEVKTGFRTSLRGAQGLYDVKPDITALGKVVGGGFPIGIVGGKEDIMMVSAPAAASDVFDSSHSKQSRAKDVLFHSGTYNGHPTILAAGLAAIAVLEEEIEHVTKTTETLKTELEKLFAERGIAMQAIGVGSIFNVVLTDKEVKNYRDLQQADFTMRRELDFRLLTKGIYTKPLNRYNMSTTHGEEEVNDTLEAYESALAEMV